MSRSMRSQNLIEPGGKFGGHVTELSQSRDPSVPLSKNPVFAKRNDWSGARGRDRTTDTAIFSRMLYQLSYPGEPGKMS